MEPLRKMTIDGADLEQNNEDSFDLDDLLHPAQALRAILASWASDACAIESVPALRRAPTKGGTPVAFDDVMDALRALDAGPAETSSRYRRVVRRRRIFGRGSSQSGHGQAFH